jgi:MFS family permease
VGYQSALQFGFKVVAGLLLGWILTKTNPKVGMLVTGAFCLASVVWVLVAPGMWFLLSFGLMGVGELFGVYYPNYIFSCSAKSKIRRNMAFSSMLNMPSSFSPFLYGWITKTVGSSTGDAKLGFQMSFLVAIAILVVTLGLVQLLLPTRPCPRKEDMDASDLALEAAVSAPV